MKRKAVIEHGRTLGLSAHEADALTISLGKMKGLKIRSTSRRHDAPIFTPTSRGSFIRITPSHISRQLLITRIKSTEIDVIPKMFTSFGEAVQRARPDNKLKLRRIKNKKNHMRSKLAQPIGYIGVVLAINCQKLYYRNELEE